MHADQHDECAAAEVLRRAGSLPVSMVDVLTATPEAWLEPLQSQVESVLGTRAGSLGIQAALAAIMDPISTALKPSLRKVCDEANQLFQVHARHAAEHRDRYHNLGQDDLRLGAMHAARDAT
jgi:hypothetical protein